MSEILMTIFLVLVTAMLVLVMVLIIMNLYEIFEEPAIQKRMRALRVTSQPWVTVLLYARDNETTIQDSLASIIRTNYTRYDIVVVNDRSKDHTAMRVKDFIKKHPKASIVLVNRRKRDTAKVALEAGYKKSKHGEVVISLRCGVAMQPDFLKRAVATKAGNELVTFRINTPSKTTSLTDIIQAFHKFIWLQPRNVIVSDADNITPTKLEVRLDILTVVLFLIIICVSILTQETIIIWYSWVIVTSYLFAVIWLNNEGLITKMKLSFSAVSALFLLPISSLLQGISQFRSRM